MNQVETKMGGKSKHAQDVTSDLDGCRGDCFAQVIGRPAHVDSFVLRSKVGYVQSNVTKVVRFLDTCACRQLIPYHICHMSHVTCQKELKDCAELHGFFFLFFAN
jgi:hypothetical protein